MTGRLQGDEPQPRGYAVGAALLVLLSGAVMVLAGVVAQADGWAVGAPITIAGGVLILAAFWTALRAGPRRGRGVSVLPRPLALAATLASGGIMVLAGYAATAWDWWLALILVPIGGLVIMAAFVLELDTRNAG